MVVANYTDSHILLVEDDVSLANLVRTYLEKNKFKVTWAKSAFDAKIKLSQCDFSLVILDIGLPDNDDFQLCAEIRKKSEIPILICTARNTNSDQIQGLELGADDYLVKPVEPKLLTAKIKALLRRTHQLEASEKKVTVGCLFMDYTKNEVLINDEPLALTTQEFEILWLLATHDGVILSRDFLIKNIRGIDFDGFDRTIDIKISKLRKKLCDDSKPPKVIKTVWGKGYIFIGSNL
jgi:DNA-binding response OmpR family regulator